MANRTTGAQRYNNRMNKMFENSRELKKKHAKHNLFTIFQNIRRDADTSNYVLEEIDRAVAVLSYIDGEY